MSTEHKGVMPSSVDFSAIDPEVYFLHVAMNPQVHFDTRQEYADPFLPGEVRRTLELNAFTATVRDNLQQLLDDLR